MSGGHAIESAAAAVAAMDGYAAEHVHGCEN